MTLRDAHRLAQHEGHRIVTAPTSEPVTLDQARRLIRTPPADENPFIQDCIVQARMMLEAATNVAFINQTWRLTLDRWPNQQDMWWDGVREMAVTELHGSSNGPEYIVLPRYPLQSVSSVTTYDQGDNANAITVGTVFFADTESYPGRLALRQGQAWPVALRQRNSIVIEYIAGFGATASDVPATIKRAILNATAFLYENRGVGCTPGAVLSASGALSLMSEFDNIRL